MSSNELAPCSLKNGMVEHAVRISSKSINPVDFIGRSSIVFNTTSEMNANVPSEPISK